MSDNKLIILLVGIQGSGKGTQGEKLEKLLGIPRIGGSDLIRETKDAELEKQIQRGEMVSDGTMIKIFVKYLENKSTDLKNGYILDGFPRNIVQANALEHKINIDIILHLKLGDDKDEERSVAIERIRKRVGEAGTSAREDNSNNKKVQKRLDDYYYQTEPIIEEYNDKVVEIDATKTEEEVFEDILKKLVEKQNILDKLVENHNILKKLVENHNILDKLKITNETGDMEPIERAIKTSIKKRNHQEIFRKLDSNKTNLTTFGNVLLEYYKPKSFGGGRLLKNKSNKRKSKSNKRFRYKKAKNKRKSKKKNSRSKRNV